MLHLKNDRLEFAFYVEDAEWFLLAGEGFLRIRGNQISGSLPLDGLKCVVSSTQEKLEIESETFRPTRSGLEGKMLTHLKLERAYTSHQRPAGKITSSFLFPVNCSHSISSFKVLIIENRIYCEEEKIALAGNSVPVYVGNGSVLGVLVFNSEDIGELHIIDLVEKDFAGVVPIRLVNSGVFSGVAFIVQVESA